MSFAAGAGTRRCFRIHRPKIRRLYGDRNLTPDAAANVFTPLVQVRRCSIFSRPFSGSHHIFIDSLSGFWKAEKEIMMVPLRTVCGAKLLYLFPSLPVQTSLLIRLSDFFFSPPLPGFSFLPDISICKHLKTFPSHAVSLSQQMRADAANPKHKHFLFFFAQPWIFVRLQMEM